MARDRNIVIKSQFNIGGSRGKSVGGFIADYVAREGDTNVSSSYINPTEIGDGVAFTLGDTAISRQETLEIAQHVENHFQTGNRAIQQLVISFDHDYLVETGVVESDCTVLANGDYKGWYDDVKLRHAIRNGLQQLIDQEGYRDARAIGAIQDDKTHIHAHVVLYEDSDLSRLRGKEEKGVVKESSFEACVRGIDAYLRYLASQAVTPEKTLPKVITVETIQTPVDTSSFSAYQQLLQQFDWQTLLIEDEENEEKEKDLQLE